MALISEFQDDQEQPQKPSSSTWSGLDAADQEVLRLIIARKGPMPFLEMTFDLLHRECGLFKDDSTVKKITALASATKAKEDAQERSRKKDVEARRASDDVGQSEKRFKEEEKVPEKKEPTVIESQMETADANGKEGGCRLMMAERLILLFKYGDQTLVRGIEMVGCFDEAMRIVCDKWLGLGEDSLCLSYSIPDHPKCVLESEADFKSMVSIALSFQIQRIAVDVWSKNESIYCSNAGDAFSSIAPCFSGDEIDLLPSFCQHPKKVLLTSGWERAIHSVGQMFEGGAKEFRLSLAKLTVESGYDFEYVKNNNETVSAECSKKVQSGCQWMVQGSRQPCNGFFYVKKFNNVHTCGAGSRTMRHKRMNSDLVACLIHDHVRIKPNTRPIEVIKYFHSDYGVEISYDIAWGAVEKAKKAVLGDDKGSVEMLRWYAQSVVDANLGSHFVIEVNEETGRFKRLFVAMNACIEGFNFCRPLLCLDGTHLKGKFKGQLLAATGKDGNEGLYPLAFAVVDAENKENWSWFLVCLKAILSPDRIITFISNRNSGLLKTISKVFPGCHHAYCLYHLKINLRSCFSGKNFKEDFKETIIDKFDECAYAPTIDLFELKVQEFLREGTHIAAKFLKNLPPENWANAYFKGNRYGLMCSNVAESFNSWIVDERILSITKLVDMIRVKLMQQLADRRDACNIFRSQICPEIDRKLSIAFNEGRSWVVNKSTNSLFEVYSEASVLVDIRKRTCSCYQWQLNGIPCSHVIACIMTTREELSSFVEDYFHTSCYAKSYSFPIYPVPSINKPDYVPTDEVILPLLSRRSPARPKKKRLRSKGEFVRTMICGRCGREGHHNRKTCKEPLD